MTVQDMVRDAMEGAAGEPVEVKAAIGAAAAVQSIPQPTTSEAAALWRTLILALSAVMVLALVGIVWTVVDGNDRTSPDVIVTVFSSALSGMLGLFVRSPS